MRVTTAAALTYLLAVASAHPPGNVWVTDTCFPSPDNTDNECTEKQSRGFDWSGLAAGPFSSYGGLDFSGFTCSVGAGKWNGSEKLIMGKLAGSSGPSISCGQNECGFSISDLYLSTSTKTDVNIVYGMPEGSTCKNVVSCSPKRTHVTNEQCGGATSVSFQLPDNSEVNGCGLQIHSIDFDCAPANVPPTFSGNQTGVSPVTSSSLIHSSSASSGPIGTSTPAETTSSSRPTGTGVSSAPSTSLTLPPSSSKPVGTSTPETTSSSPVRLTTSTVYATKEITVTSCAPPVVSCPASSTTVVTTTVPVSTSVGPVTETETLPATPPLSVAPVSTSTPVIKTPGSTPGIPNTSDTPDSPDSSDSPDTTGNPPAETPAPSSTAVGSKSGPGGAVTTVVTYETVTTCPVTSTITSGGSTIPTTYTTASTVTTTSVSTICTECAATRTPTGGTPTGSSPINTTPGPSGVLPGSSSLPGGTVTTVITYETVTTCPVTSTITSGGSTIPTTYTTASTITTTSVSTVCTQCVATPTPSPTENSPTGNTPSGTPSGGSPGDTPTGNTPTGGTPSGSTPGDTPTGGTPTGSTVTVVTTPGPSGVLPGSSSLPGDSARTTIVTYETVTTCPVTSTITSGGSRVPTTYTTASTVTTTSVSTICTQCPATPTPAPTGGTPTGNSASSPINTAPGPSGVLPGSSSLPGGPATTTVVTYETVTTCPVTSTITSGGSAVPTTYTTVSTVTTTSVSTICPSCSAAPAPSPGTGTGTGTAPAAPPTVTVTSAPCPTSVPKCINTWLTLIPKCNSNSDASCFCPSTKFTERVISCIRAWGASEEEIQSALSYFTGICGAHVPENPGIVTAIPTTITLVPTAPPPTGVAAVSPSPTPAPAPSQPGSQPTQPARTTITYASYTVTVPQVQFTTETGGSTPSVGLVPAMSMTAATSSRPLITYGFWTSYTASPSGSGPAANPSGSPSIVLSTNSASSGLLGWVSWKLLATVGATVFGLLF